jgi:hypothetical protein
MEKQMTIVPVSCNFAILEFLIRWFAHSGGSPDEAKDGSDLQYLDGQRSADTGQPCHSVPSKRPQKTSKSTDSPEFAKNWFVQKIMVIQKISR